MSSTATLSATVDRAVRAAGLAYPNLWVAINSQGAAHFTNGVQTYQAQPYDVMLWTMPTVSGAAYSTTVKGYVDQLTPTANASVETAVQVQLG